MKGESLLALLAGAAAGLTLGVLFAPESGEETRKKIKKAAAEGYEELSEFAGEAGHKLHVRARYARKEMKALKKTLAEQGDNLKEDVREKLLKQIAKLEKALAEDNGEVDEQAQPE